MRFQELRQEMLDYYLNVLPPTLPDYYEKVKNILDERYQPGMSVCDMKLMQYQVILENFTPIVMRHSPFFFITGTQDGRDHRSKAARWVYQKNEHIFWEQDEELTRRRQAQTREHMYGICGPFNDVAAHFSFHYRPILEKGLQGVYEDAKLSMEGATEEEKDYLQMVLSALELIREIAGRFASQAEKLEKEAIASGDEAARLHYAKAAADARRLPWEKPRTMQDAMEIYLFYKEILEGFEGVSSNSFGRIDIDLYPFYQRDIENGVLTPESAFDLICQFLICSDCRYDHNTLMEEACDHELENTYVLGGCDTEGKPVWNDLTRMFLIASREEKIIFPKVFCRFSSQSPKEYLEEAGRSIMQGTATMLFQNDDAMIPALLRAGRPVEEARDYLISGCWDVFCNGVERIDSAVFFNLIFSMICPIHQLTDTMKEVGIQFEPLDAAENFEQLYAIVVENIRREMVERHRVTYEGGHIWNQVELLPMYSCTMGGCLEKRRDFSAAGSKYRDEKVFCVGMPNIIDSLLAMKTICFDEKRCSLKEYLDAVRANWQDHEELRQAATRCHGWGDGNEDSTALAVRLNQDLYNITQSIVPNIYGGKLFLGYLSFTEIRFWGEVTPATPDGRLAGDFYAHGLTPSRLKKIPSTTSVVSTMAQLDPSMWAGNSVVNVILPSGKINLDILCAFIRTCGQTAIQSLQLNCFSKQQLLDAQVHPENYEDLVVRVTGFSAKFTSLSPAWQKEVITRNFYEE